MEEEKKENKEKYWNRALDAVLNVGRGQSDQLFVSALLVKRIDKLTNSIKKSLKSSDDLTKITNKLTGQIKTQTWVMIVIALLALAIGGYATFFRGVGIKEAKMINNFPLSAISISVALLGVMVNAFLIKPYIGVCVIAKTENARKHDIKSTLGKIANIFIVIGTVGHWISVIFF